MKKKILIAVLLLTVPVTAEDTPTVVCTTTALQTLAQQVGGPHVDVIFLVQPGVCPSHFDVRPSHISEVNQAILVLSHGVEPWLDGLISASSNDNVERVELKGPWNTPALAAEKINAIRDALVSADPENASSYNENAEKAVSQLEEAAEKIKKDAALLNIDIEEIPVLCMEWHASFVEWIGFSVAGTYGPPETLSIKEVDQLIKTGKDSSAILVIDNLQSGTEIGSEIAVAIGGYHVILTNFPQALPKTDTIAAMLEYNARQLLETTGKYEEEKGRIYELESKLKEEKRKKQIFEALVIVLFTVCIIEAVILMRKK